MNRFADLINRAEYYEAHEVMEEIWILNNRPRPSILQSLIQIAASLEHVKRENINGARALAMRALQDIQMVPNLPEEVWEWSSFLREFKQYAIGDFQGQPPALQQAKS